MGLGRLEPEAPQGPETNEDWPSRRPLQRPETAEVPARAPEAHANRRSTTDLTVFRIGTKPLRVDKTAQFVQFYPGSGE